MTPEDTFVVDGWACRLNGTSRQGNVFTQYCLIDVPANGGAIHMPYHYALHFIGGAFVASDFSPAMWHGRPDRFTNLTSRVGVHVDFRKLCRVCFNVFKLKVAMKEPLSVFVVCGSRTVGKDMTGATDANAPTRKYQLYKFFLTPIARDSGYWLADDSQHSLFLLCPLKRTATVDSLIADYWTIRKQIDHERNGIV